MPRHHRFVGARDDVAKPTSSLISVSFWPTSVCWVCSRLHLFEQVIHTVDILGKYHECLTAGGGHGVELGHGAEIDHASENQGRDGRDHRA